MKRNLPLTLLLGLSLIIALFTLNHYGESWDELKLYDYAADSLKAYVMWPQHGAIPVTGDHFENYGPAFMMFSSIVTKGFKQIFPAAQSVDIRHLIYFLTFLIGVWAFYQLATRWMSRNAAFGATLLFMTQPLFWGHAFINPKDIPLLSFFLLTVYLGMRMHELILGSETGSLSSAWNELAPRTRRLLIAMTSFWLVSIVLLFGGTPLIHQWLDRAIRAAANGEPSLLPLIATRIHRIAPEIYIEKFFVLFLRARAIYFLMLTGILIWLYRRHLPTALRVLRMILPAGIVLGLAVSIRIFGVWAGVLVIGYLLWKTGRKAWLMIAVYALIAIMAMYVTWPYLWPNPVGHFFETAQVMAQHPWPGSVLFNGATYSAQHLPASYMPILLAIQFTEPVWILFMAGVTVAIYGSVKRRMESRELLALTLVWFVLPLVTFVVLRPTLYDNFRQTFFIVPPIFFMTGLAFEQLRRPVLQGTLIALLILPGLIASVRLHPYEYVYYNQWIGGIPGAVDRFELDYWGTSYRAAASEANRIAPPNSNVWVDGPAHLFSRFARPDFHIYSPQEAERADHYDVVVTLVRYNWEKTSFPQAKIVYSVRRADTTFAIIREP
ncbi:MAG TPA: glycosyltransferase family 39 protein [Anaerolineales bacterium]|nr:glycosyltransferase family 39 protein [Anaerolineales bacterium]